MNGNSKLGHANMADFDGSAKVEWTLEGDRCAPVLAVTLVI